MNLYYKLATVVIAYLVLLFLVNRVPHVSVGSIGFFCLKGLTIELPDKLIKIKSLQLKIKLWKRRDERTKYVQLIIAGVQVYDKPRAAETAENSNTKEHKKQAKQAIDVKNLVSFNIPRRIYDLMYRYKVLNQCTIALIELTAYLDDATTLTVQYSTLDNLFLKDGHNTLALAVFNGFVIHAAEAAQLFRNVEVGFSFDAITSVTNKYSVNNTLSNFQLTLVFGKVSLPLSELKGLVKSRKEKLNHHFEEERNQKRQDEIREHLLDRISALSEQQVNVLRDTWSLFDKARITFDDLTVSQGMHSIRVANFQVSLAHFEEAEVITTDMAQLHVHLSNLEVFENTTDIMKLANASLSLECHPFSILQGLRNLPVSKVLTDLKKERADFILKFTATNPTVNLYFDQIAAFEDRSKKATKKTKQKSSNLNFMNLLLVFQRFSTKIVVVDTKVVLHLPPLGASEYHRDSPQNSIVTHTVEALAQRFACKDLASLVYNKQVHRKRLHTIFKLKNYKAEVLDNLIHLTKCNLLVSYSVDDENFSVRFSAKNMALKSINSAIFRLTREMQTRRILRYNKRYAELRGQQRDTPPPADDMPVSKVFIQIFEILPPIVDHVSIDIHNVQADIICKDGLPAYKFFDQELDEEVDLADYRRGVSLKISGCSLKYNKPDEEFTVNVTNVQSFTMSEYTTDYVEDFDVVTAYNDESEFSDISSLGSTELADHEDYSLNKVKRVLDIEAIEVSNLNNKQRDKNKLSVKIPVVDGRIDIFLAWCSVYAMSLVESYTPQVHRNCTKEEMRSLTGKEEKLLKLDIFVNSCSVVLRLPNHVDTMMELDTLALHDIFENFSIDLKYFRNYVIHPKTKLWARCLCLKDIHVNLKPKDKSESFIVYTGGIRLNIPFGFEFYKVVDNLVTFGKAIRQVTHNFQNLCNDDDDFNRLLPQARGAFPVPSLNIKTKIFGLTIENDPFETELGYIYEVGFIEQKERIRKWKLFEERAEALKKETIESKIELSVENDPRKKNIPKIFSPLRKVFTEAKAKQPPQSSVEAVTELPPPVSDEEVTRRIDRARDILEAELGTSWIKKFKRFKSFKIDNWQNRADRVWGEETINDIIVEKFDILNYSSGPLLMGAVFADLDFGVSQATVDDIDKFLYDFGKGQPKLDYSILIPAHLSVKSKGVFVFLKDYTLPLLSFPSNSNPNETAFHLSGNIVINEKIVYRKEEMRFIKVPFSPPQAENFDTDSFYHTFVARTLTPIKFMMNLKCHINSDRAAILTWCESYSSALATSMTAVDKFTKPQIDDSPLGWWDKMALLCHGRMQFDIPNELCLHMKASGNPYELIGRASGFVFSWKNNVSLIIHDNDNPKELLKLDSDDFLLAIPNYNAAERRTWSFFYDELPEEAIDFDSEAKKYQKRVMKFSSDERVRWKMGLLFERNEEKTNTLSNNNKRTSEFIPHYDVVVTNPCFDWHPDSYEGFRSDYLHLSIGVQSTSKKGNASNTVHLTPLVFTYFFYWWDTLTNLSSLPVRQGKLYDNRSVDKSHVNMSPHLFTVKYQLILEPLTISHMYIHATGDKNSKVAFTGLKAKASKCVIDLHQRKEIMTYVNEQLNIRNHTMKLKMNQAEIVFDSPDIRLVNAVFPDKSFKVKVAKYLAGSVLSPSDSSSGEDFGSNIDEWQDNINVYDGDYSWVDNEDFIELETREILSPYPKITVHPFAYSPRLTYIREFSLNEEGSYPFGAEDSHDCQLGLEKPEDTQARLLKRRLAGINEEIETNEDLLKDLGHASDDPSFAPDSSFIKEQLKACKDKKEVIESIHELMEGSYASDETSETQSSSSEVSRLHSRQLSVYSSHKSFADLKEAKIINKDAANFHNRFIVHNLQMKWNNSIRDMFLDYIQHVSDRRSEAYFMSKKAVDLVESMINSVSDTDVGSDHGASNDDVFEQEHEISEDIMNTFYENLQEYNKETEEPENKYLIKLVHPQIQLVSELDPNSAILIGSRDLELRIIAINVKGIKDLINESTHISGLIETRYGGLFDDSSIFVFTREDTIIIDPDVPYGYAGNQLAMNWPPWVEVEALYNDSWAKRQLIAHRNSMALSYSKPNFLYVESSKISQLITIKQHLPKIVLTMDSKQYSTLFYVITDLLMKARTTRDEVMNRIEKVMALSDTEDFYGLDTKVSELQRNIRDYHDILLRLDAKTIKLSPSENQGAMHVEMELEKMRLELGMIMRGLRLRNSKSKATRRMENLWGVSAQQIIWHFIDSNGAPLIDLALANTQFTRLDGVDGSNKNQLDVLMIQGFNLQEKSVYPELLQPILDEGEQTPSRPVIRVSWQMLNPVGGIPIVQYARLSILPLKIQLDYHTSTLLFDYLFPKNDKSAKSTSQESSNMSKQSTEKSSIASVRANGRRDFTPNSSIQSSSRPSETFSANDSEEESSPNSNPQTEGDTCKLGRKKARRTADHIDDISTIVARSSKFMSIMDMELKGMKLIVSFKAPPHLNIIDVHNLSLNVPTLKYTNKIWCSEDIIYNLRKDVIKVVLSHTGKILSNKFKVRRRSILTTPLKQISNYVSYVSVQDLQSESQTNANSEYNRGARLPQHRSQHHHHHHHHHSTSSEAQENPQSQTLDSMLREIADEEEDEEAQDTNK